MKNKEVLIIGGGLAGLTAAIHLSKIGLQVIVIEKNGYPKHKVCGEYISNEIIPYFRWLEIDISHLNPASITHLEFTTSRGKMLKTKLPLGGFGISRYALDELLYKKAITNGCRFIQDNVDAVFFDANHFNVTTNKNGCIQSELVIGAFGKRSNIDYKMNRDFMNQKSSWLAVKAHYTGDFCDNIVGLHNFKGGYCGVSKVENNIINICYLADYTTFKKYKNIEEYQDNVLAKNLQLKTILSNSTLIFDKPLTISQISFDKKHPVENHVLMIGDSAGLIHPLCGNGMAMAIHSAKIVSETIQEYYTKSNKSRTALENKYTKQWNFNFKKRLYVGRLLSNILQKQNLSIVLMQLLSIFPFLLPMIIKNTHGKPIHVQS